MGRVCCYYCQSTPSKMSGLTLHTLPADKNVHNAWLKACGYIENNYSPHRKICSLHFEDNCYKATKLRKLLKTGAVPTKFHKVAKNVYVNKPKKQMVVPMVPYNIFGIESTKIFKIFESSAKLVTTRKISQTNSTPSECIIEIPKRKRILHAGDVTTMNFNDFKVAKLNIKTLIQRANRLGKKLTLLNTRMHI